MRCFFTVNVFWKFYKSFEWTPRLVSESTNTINNKDWRCLKNIIHELYKPFFVLPSSFQTNNKKRIFKHFIISTVTLSNPNHLSSIQIMDCDWLSWIYQEITGAYKVSYQTFLSLWRQRTFCKLKSRKCRTSDLIKIQRNM